jgi:hypothetical protein
MMALTFNQPAPSIAVKINILAATLRSSSFAILDEFARYAYNNVASSSTARKSDINGTRYCLPLERVPRLIDNSLTVFLRVI